MCIFAVWAGGEFDRNVAGREIYIEPGDYGVDEIISSRVKLERCRESEVRRCDLVKIDGKDTTRICNAGFDFDSVN